MTDKKIAVLIMLSACLALTLGIVVNEYRKLHELKVSGSGSASFSLGSVHCTITVEKDGKKIMEEYHAGAITKLGINYTLGKITGNSTFYNMTQYPYNVTYVSIGNQGALTTDSTVLPGEWNRTLGTQHDTLYDRFNVTAVFKGTSGTQTADCIGLNINISSTIGADYTLFAYDTFTEVTGIDSTFTITVEFKVTLS